ncbi:MAG: hypothetical protein LV481_04320 [Methylacidiphilales bacterium]|nr:hypothetical protein [Candidatus Methylacidiphilales bacterium]
MQNSPQTSSGTSISFGADSVYAKTSYVPPDMTIFGVEESKLDSLSEIGTRANVFLSVASGAIGIAISCVIAAIAVDKLCWECGILLVAALFFFIITAVFGFLAKNEMNSKDNLIGKIKKNRIYYEPQGSPEAK